MLDIPEVPHTREFVEATNQQSANGYREYIAGLKDAEEFTVPCNYIPGDTSQEAVWDMYELGTARYWRLRETTTSPEATMTFLAIVAGVSYAYPVADKKVMNVTLRRTGPSVRA